MTAETEVIKEVSEVSKVEIEEKCGLDMSSYQDLSKPNGINHVGGNVDDDSDSRDSPIDNSYVFVNGSDDGVSDDPVDKVIPVEETKVSPESIAESQNHVGSGEGNVSNGDIVEHPLPEINYIVQESDAVPVNSVDSLKKDEGDEVQVAVTGSEKQNDRIIGNADADSEELKDQIESESCIQPVNNLESRAASTDSVEQPNGIIAPNLDIKPELLEASVKPRENKESQVVVLEANAESVGSEEIKTLSPDINDAGDEYKEIKESNLQASDGLSRGQDSQIVVLEAGVESGATNELKSASSDTTQAADENEEIKQSNFDTSDDVSQGQNSEVVGLEVNVESGEESKVVSPDVKESGDENKEIDEVQECKNVVLNLDAESGDRGELKILSPDVKETGDEDKETEGKNSETSHELTAVQESQNVNADAAGYQSAEIESSKTNLEEEKDFESSNEYREGHESQNLASEASVYQSAEMAVENGNSEEGNSLHSTDDLTDNHKSENVILEAIGCQLGDVDVGMTDESIEGRDSQNVALNAPESVSEEVEFGIVDSEQQREVESLKQVEESEHSLVPGAVSSDSVSCQPDDGGEKELDEEEKTDLCSNGKEIHVSDTTLNEGIQVNAEAKSSVNETDTPSEAENASDSILVENKDDLDVSHISEFAQETEDPNGCVGGGENSLEVNGSFISDHSLPLAGSMRPGTEIIGKPVESDKSPPSGSRAVTTVQHEIKPQASTLSDAKYIEDVGPCPVDNTKLDTIESETVVENGSIDGQNISSCPVNDEGLETEPAVETIDSEEKASSFQVDDVHSKTKDLSGDVESSHSCSVSADLKLDPQVDESCIIGSGYMVGNDLIATGTVILDSSAVDKESASNVVSEIVEVGNVGDEFNDVDRSREHNLICQESSGIEKSHITEVAASMTEHSTVDAMAGAELGVELMTRPFNFLIRIPRFDDEKLRERIRHAQLQVEEKTQCRDAFRLEIQKKKANLQTCGVEFEAAIGEERDARRLVKKKRIEIESLQSVINRVKNAISVEDIDARISNMEHMIQHETMPLKEEKQLIREIKQLKQLREQLSSNIGSQDEVQQALDQKDQIEDRLKALKKELESFKNMVLKAQAVATTARKKYDGENKKFKELQDQFKAADDIRQAAYAQLLSLRRELFEKNKQFRMYKDDAAAASDYALNRNREALHRLCVNQVETIMELWNKNDEFRREYVRCNLRSTVRRLGTLDGRSLGPDEEPPVVPSYADERVDRSIKNQHKTSSVSQTAVEQKTDVTPVGGVVAVDKSMTKVAESVKQTVKIREPAKSALENGSLSSAAADTTNDYKEEHVQTKEEIELARKAEELRKEEEAAKLKELRRLEEIAKAREAQERKRRNAEKALMKAELRAQKEAEQKEKEREKRLRKKERKKAGAEAHEDNNDGETAQSSESAIETTKDPEIKEIPATVTKRPSQFVKQSKSKTIPPPLRNRSRRKMQQWMWVIFTSLVVIALFLLGNIGVFSNLRPRKSGF